MEISSALWAHKALEALHFTYSLTEVLSTATNCHTQAYNVLNNINVSLTMRQ